MRYADGREAKLGDVIAIASKHRGTVVANFDGGEYAAEYPEAEWRHLKSGILVNTDFAGLVHYANGEYENLALVARK